MDDGDLPLGDALALLRALWRLDHALARASTRMERRLGITAPQRFVLRCVGRYPGVTAGQLAAVMHVDRGTMTSLLDRLEEKRLLTRRRDPRDRRRVTVGLTAEGRALDTPDEHTIEAAVERYLAAADPDDVAALRGGLARLTEAIDGAAPDEASARRPPPTKKARATP